jgi:hypothetical protein
MSQRRNLEGLPPSSCPSNLLSQSYTPTLGGEVPRVYALFPGGTRVEASHLPPILLTAIPKDQQSPRNRLPVDNTHCFHPSRGLIAGINPAVRPSFVDLGSSGSWYTESSSNRVLRHVPTVTERF